MKMKEKLIKIFNHYGYINQLRQLNEECFELEEALILSNKENIAEELADVMVMLKQFQLFYSISTDELKDIIKYKIERQIGRIENENTK